MLKLDHLKICHGAWFHVSRGEKHPLKTRSTHRVISRIKMDAYGTAERRPDVRHKVTTNEVICGNVGAGCPLHICSQGSVVFLSVMAGQAI